MYICICKLVHVGVRPKGLHGKKCNVFYSYKAKTFNLLKYLTSKVQFTEKIPFDQSFCGYRLGIDIYCGWQSREL